jgi:hypothetical protein
MDSETESPIQLMNLRGKEAADWLTGIESGKAKETWDAFGPAYAALSLSSNEPSQPQESFRGF